MVMWGPSCVELNLCVEGLVGEVLGAQLGQERGKQRQVGLHLLRHAACIYQGPLQKQTYMSKLF
jgi:hypothetical protein